MNHSTRWVHFKPSKEQLATQQHTSEHQEELNQNQFIQTWQQRHKVLSKLAPVLLRHHHQLQDHSNQHPKCHHSYQSYQHLVPPSMKNSSHALNFHFGFIIELAQSLILNSQMNPEFYSDSQTKLLQRCLNTQIDPKTDFNLIRKISEGQSGSVHLIKTRLSSLESLNQSNFYILKKVSKRVSQRIQPYSSIQTELSILLLSRAERKTGDEKNAENFTPIPQLHLSFQTKEELNLIIKFNSNGTISDYLNHKSDPEKPLEESILRSWSIDVLSGLNWLHKENYFCHRDVKPSNLLINDLGHILLNDFGTAAPLIKIYNNKICHPSQSFSNSPTCRLVVPVKFRSVIVGTCDYIAPEVLQVHLNQTIANLNQSCPSPDRQDDYQSQNKLDDREEANEEYLIDSSYGPEIDFWSFGISLYELVYGELPFFSQSIIDTYDRIVSHLTYLKIPNVRYREINEAMENRRSVQVSQGLQKFLKSLICSREIRIGCGSEGIEQVQNHEWFQGLDWNKLRKSPVPNFTPSPLHINQFGESVGSDSIAAEEDAGVGFHFSAFFGSSPGLTALQSNNKQDESCIRTEFFKSDQSSGNQVHQHQNDEDLNFWGFTYFPANPDEFDKPQEDRHLQILKSSIKRAAVNSKSPVYPTKSSTPMKEDVDKFSTPIKWKHQINRHSSNRADDGNNRLRNSINYPPQTNLINRSIRLKTGQDGQQIRLTEIDELMELNQFILRTAKKTNTNHRQSNHHQEFDLKDEDSIDYHHHLSPIHPLRGRDGNQRNNDDHGDQKKQIHLEIGTTHEKLSNLVSRLDQLLLKSDQTIQNSNLLPP